MVAAPADHAEQRYGIERTDHPRHFRPDGRHPDPGAFKIGTNLKDNEWMLNYQNLKRRIDWGLTYYRNAQNTDIGLTDASGNLLAVYPGKIFTNLYQVIFPIRLMKPRASD